VLFVSLDTSLLIDVVFYYLWLCTVEFWDTCSAMHWIHYYFLCYASSLLHCFVGFAFVNLVSLWCEELTEMVVYHWTGPSGGIFSSSTRVVTLKTLSCTGGNHWYFSHVLLLQRWSSEVGSWNFF